MAAKFVQPIHWREAKLYFRVGFECVHCGSRDTFRHVYPASAGWLHKCWTCSSLDDSTYPIEGGTDKKAPYYSKADLKRLKDRAHSLAPLTGAERVRIVQEAAQRKANRSSGVRTKRAPSAAVIAQQTEIAELLEKMKVLQQMMADQMAKKAVVNA